MGKAYTQKNTHICKPHKANAQTKAYKRMCFLPTLNRLTTNATEKRGSR